MVLQLVLPFLFGLSVVLIFIGLSLPPKLRPEQERLQMYGTRPRTLAEMEMAQPFSERVALPLIRGIAQFIQRFAPQRNIQEISHKLDLAGNPNRWSPSDFLGVRGLVSFISTVVVLVPLLLSRAQMAQVLLFGGIAAILGFYLPLFWLNLKIRQRKHDILKSLPDALDLLTISVEAGLGFDAAMVKVAEKWENELSRAFSRAIIEVRLGKIRREALRDMANRADVPDLSNFIAAVIQVDQLGVSLARVLRIQSEQMRIKRRQRAEEEAAKAPVRMMFPLVFLIFPSILIVLLGPAAIIFFRTGGLAGGR